MAGCALAFVCYMYNISVCSFFRRGASLCVCVCVGCCREKVTSVAIDKTDGIIVHLPATSLDTEVSE